LADGKVRISTELDKSGFESGLNQMKASASKGSDLIKDAFTTIGVAIGAAATAIGVAGFNYNKQMENASAAFKVLLGSADKAKNMLAELERFANSTPFDLPGVSNAAKTLLAFGVNANDVMPILKNLGDISMGNSENFQRLALVFGQVQAQGKMMTQDFYQMINVGFNPLEYISKRTGQSMSELKDQMEKGAITTDMVTQAFKDATSEGGRFYGAMDEYAKTFGGRWSTFMDAFGKFSGAILQPFYNLITNQILPALTNLMSQLTADIQTGNWNAFLETIKAIGLAITVATAAMIGFKTGAIIQSVIQSFQLAQVSLALYTATANGATIAQGVLNGTLTVWETLVALLTGKITIVTFVTGLWTKAQAALNAVFLANSIGIVIAIIAVLVAAIIYLWNTNEGFRNAVTAIWNKIVQMFKDSAKWIVDTWNATVTWFQELPSKFKAVVDGIVKWFAEMPSRIWTWLVETFNKVVAWISDLQNKMNYGMAQVINAVVTWFQQLPSKIWAWLVETVSKVSAWISNLGSTMSSGISGIINNVVSWFAQLPGKLYNVGSDIVKGLWNGISGAAGWLYNKVSTFCSGLLSGMMKALGENSPSRITAGYGKYLAQGLGIGFGKEIGNIYSDMSNAIDLQNAKLNWSVQAGNSYNNIMSIQPITVDGTYTSYLNLDGETITKSVNRINDRRSLQYGY
jgi:tape measure domain-containing protein